MENTDKFPLRIALRNVEGMLLGSVSHKVVGLADCNVMPVR